MKPIAVLLTTVPATAFASPIYVEYEGVVSDVRLCGCMTTEYSVGDTIKGVVIIDMGRAPGDSPVFPGANQGHYTGEFLSGFDAPFIPGTGNRPDSIA